MKIGKQTIKLENTPKLLQTASVVGKKEMQGPLASFFDVHTDDEFFGEKSFEKAESKLMSTCINTLLSKTSSNFSDIDYIFAGDLLNQCISSGYAIRDTNIPFLGLYGACSTFCEGLMLSSLFVNAGYATNTINATSSHFCSAERQFRLPLEQGTQSSSTSQATVTGSGSAFVTNKENPAKAPYITFVTPGKIVDMGIQDMANMGAAMAPAAYSTISEHLNDTKRNASYYDAIVTGDLGSLGSEILVDLFKQNDVDISNIHKDCGCMIYDLEKQDVKCGGSGCGCMASVFSSYFFDKLMKKEINKILIVATGALMSPLACQQGESIPCIAHAVAIENEV